MNQVKISITTLLLIFSFNIYASGHSHSRYKIDTESSSLSMATIKKQYIVEPATITNITGGLMGDNLEVDIDLSTIDTKVPIRNDRVKEIFFNIAKFPKASVSAKIDKKMLKFDDIKHLRNFSFDLTLFGTTKEVMADILLAELEDDKIMVVTTAPIIIDAANFGIPDSNLMNLAKTVGGIDLSNKVPVNFILVLEED